MEFLGKARRSVKNLHPDYLSSRVIVEYDAFPYLVALRVRRVAEFEGDNIFIFIIAKFHGFLKYSDLFPALCRRIEFRMKDFVHEAVFLRLLRAHVIVAVGIFRDLLKRLAGVLGENLVKVLFRF